MSIFYVFFYFQSALDLHYDIPTYSVKKFRHHRPRGSIITDTTDHYGPIIMVGGVGGDFSHTPSE